MTRSLSDTLTRLSARGEALRQGAMAGSSGGLETLPPLSRNPGALTARLFVPASLRAGAPLVVALHGCTQTAAGYDVGTGWSALAEAEGFAVLLPEQARANNPNLCFNWFQPADIGRTGGEAESIALMIEAMIARHRLDPARVYVTGLSAGGAMTAVMLATYPELFAGGAIIGGLPYGCAMSVPEAFDRMRGHGGADDAGLVAAVKAASAGFKGSWPTVSVWHGTADATVSFSNMDSIGRQWRGVHGVLGAPAAVESGSGWTRRSWRGADGRVVVEDWSVTGMGHGVPIDASGVSPLGETGPYMLDVGLSSTAAIAASWGLVRGDRAVERVVPPVVAEATPASFSASPEASSPLPVMAGRVQKVIEDALRGAGLLR